MRQRALEIDPYYVAQNSSGDRLGTRIRIFDRPTGGEKDRMTAYEAFAFDARVSIVVHDAEAAKDEPAAPGEANPYGGG